MKFWNLPKILLEIPAFLLLLWLGLWLLDENQANFTLKSNGLRKFLQAQEANSQALSSDGNLQDSLLQAGLSDLAQAPADQTQQALAPYEGSTEAQRYEQFPRAGQVKKDSRFILLVGDSMTEQLRFAFEQYAAQNGHRLVTCTWYSSTTLAWHSTARLQQLIDEYEPDFIFFTLGGNEIFTRNLERREPLIKTLIHQADTAQIPFVWLGTPAWKPDNGFNALVSKLVGKSRYYPSERLSLERGPDGAHPTRQAAAVWADSIGQWFRDSSYYRFDLLWDNPKEQPTPQTYQANAERDARLPWRQNKVKVRVFKVNEMQVYRKGATQNAQAKPDAPKPTKQDDKHLQPRPNVDSLGKKTSDSL